MAAIYGDTGASIWPSGIALTRSTRLITPRMATKPIHWLTEAWHL